MQVFGQGVSRSELGRDSQGACIASSSIFQLFDDTSQLETLNISTQ